jgi:hypothetical protein
MVTRLNQYSSSVFNKLRKIQKRTSKSVYFNVRKKVKIKPPRPLYSKPRRKEIILKNCERINHIFKNPAKIDVALQIIERAKKNPYFINEDLFIEISKSLVEKGINLTPRGSSPAAVKAVYDLLMKNEVLKLGLSKTYRVG